MQQYTVYLYLQTVLYDSGGISTHHQELMSLYLQYLAFLRPLLLPERDWIGTAFREILFWIFTQIYRQN